MDDEDLSGMPFDEGKVFLLNDDYHGNILVGFKSGKLLGIINFGVRYKNFVSDWLDALVE